MAPPPAGLVLHVQRGEEEQLDIPLTRSNRTLPHDTMREPQGRGRLRTRGLSGKDLAISEPVKPGKLFCYSAQVSFYVPKKTDG